MINTGLVNTVLNLVLLLIGVPLLVWVARRIDSIATRFERLEVAVVGMDGKSGILGEVERMRSWKHDDFSQWAQDVNNRVTILEERSGAVKEIAEEEREARLRLERRVLERP